MIEYTSFKGGDIRYDVCVLYHSLHIRCSTKKRTKCTSEVGSGGFCRQKNWQNSVLFLVSFMHVWDVDKEMEQNPRNCPP